ncbi:MAG: MarR family transcriptional regulator [Rhodospirillales bacterium 69-11]|nr:MAG: MarR family transcriptional regulator [Rhodospirillales bacterium 69-11]
MAEFRYLLRRFLAFSETAAKDAGLTPRQHQALLAIKGFGGEEPVAIQDLAERLGVQHHSAVELVDRLAEAGLLDRRADPVDRRKVRLVPTAAAERHLATLSAAHLDELRRLRPALIGILQALDEAPSC